MCVDTALRKFTVNNQGNFQAQQQLTLYYGRGNLPFAKDQTTNLFFHNSTYNSGMKHTKVYHVDSEV